MLRSRLSSRAPCLLASSRKRARSTRASVGLSNIEGVLLDGPEFGSDVTSILIRWRNAFHFSWLLFVGDFWHNHFWLIYIWIYLIFFTLVFQIWRNRARWKFVNHFDCMGGGGRNGMEWLLVTTLVILEAKRISAQ